VSRLDYDCSSTGLPCGSDNCSAGSAQTNPVAAASAAKSGTEKSVRGARNVHRGYARTKLAVTKSGQSQTVDSNAYTGSSAQSKATQVATTKPVRDKAKRRSVGRHPGRIAKQPAAVPRPNARQEDARRTSQAAKQTGVQEHKRRSHGGDYSRVQTLTTRSTAPDASISHSAHDRLLPGVHDWRDHAVRRRVWRSSRSSAQHWFNHLHDSCPRRFGLMPQARPRRPPGGQNRPTYGLPEWLAAHGSAGQSRTKYTHGEDNSEVRYLTRVGQVFPHAIEEQSTARLLGR